MAAIWTGFGAAAVGCFVAVVGAMLSWIPDAGATGSSSSTVRAGILTFLAAQHGGTTLNGVTMRFVPLGLTIIAVWLCWRAGRALQALPVVAGDQRERRIAGLVTLQVGAYALTCAFLTKFSVIGTSSAPAFGAVAGAVGVAVLGFGAAAARYSPLGLARWRRVPVLIRAAMPAAAGGVAIFIAGGALLAAGATVRHGSRFLELSRGLSSGLSGLPIATLDLLSAPNAVLACTSYLAGPGFAVGVHSTYGPFGGRAGLVPAFPILAGLPAGSRATTLVLVLVTLTVVGAGVVAGLLVRRDAGQSSWLGMLGSALLAGVFTGAALGLLVAAAGGSLGTRNLRAVGASPWQVALMTAAQVCVVAAPVSVVSRLLVRRRQSITHLGDLPGSSGMPVSARTAGSASTGLSDDEMKAATPGRPKPLARPAPATEPDEAEADDAERRQAAS